MLAASFFLVAIQHEFNETGLSKTARIIQAKS
jgi:hypothetical protein